MARFYTIYRMIRYGSTGLTPHSTRSDIHSLWLIATSKLQSLAYSALKTHSPRVDRILNIIPISIPRPLLNPQSSS